MAVVSEFCTVEPNICGSPIWNLPLVTLRAPGTSSWVLDFWNNLCTPDLGRVPECDDT